MARLISAPGCHAWLGECGDSTGRSAADGSATGRWGDRVAHRLGGTGHLRYPEPDAYQDRLPVLEFYLAIVALHHRDRAIRGIGMVRAGRDASPQTPQGTPRKPAGLTRRTLARQDQFDTIAQRGVRSGWAEPASRNANNGSELPRMRLDQAPPVTLASRPTRRLRTGLD